MGTLVIDLDGTIATQEKSGQYHLAKPRQEVINKMQEYHNSGWKIVIFTARGMKTFQGNQKKCEEVYRELTETWLETFNVPYDYLLFGKPAGDLYIDDKGCQPDEFISRSDF